MTSVFFWIGVGFTAAFAIVALLAALFLLYAWLIHGRFGLIFFRKSQHRLSIVSWHQARLTYKGDDRGDKEWPADDWPINERPFCLTYRIGTKRVFILAGMLGEHRSNVISGTHPTLTPETK
jgi:hypothetical protein